MTKRRRRHPSFALLPVVALVVVVTWGWTPASGAASASVRTAQWIIEENAKPGTSAWRIPSGTRKGIAGYADRISAKAGETIKLYVKTRSPSFHVEAYRLGHYQGLGGRPI